MNKYIYIRVSGKDQNEARQVADLENLDIPAENVYIEKQSGKDFDRPKYQELISRLQEGDIVYFHSIDRLGRNYEQIIENWNRITKEIKADIVILDMPLLDTTTRSNDLTGKFIADLVLQILSYVAQKERENIRQRQAEGIAIAVKEGKYRKKDIDMDLARQLKADVEKGLISIASASKKLGISRQYWYRLVKKFD